MRISFLLILCSVFISCSTKKVTEFNITNKNNYPISVTVTTNNITHTFSGIKPDELFTGIYDWTGLKDTEGQWIFLIKNDQTGGADKFSHGYFAHGELFNYVTLECKGDQLKVQITE